MDPRRAHAVYPAKRALSRSPEGGQARKHFKPDLPGNSQSPRENENASSRQSPVSDGTRRDPRVDAPRGPKATAQASVAQNRALDASPVRSPRVGVGSNTNSSARSTPAPAFIDAQSGQPGSGQVLDDSATADAAMGDSSASGFNPILEQLVTFSNQVATQASIKIAHSRAQIRADRAQLEYDSNRKQFDAFPAVKERKTSERAAAKQELDTQETRLKESKVVQRQMMASLADMIGQTQRRDEPVVPDADVVSRADFEKLVALCHELETNLEVATDRMGSLKTSAENAANASSEAHSALALLKVDAAKAKLIGDAASTDLRNLKNEFAELKTQTTTLQTWKTEVEPLTRLNKDRADLMRKDFEHLRSEGLKSLATKQELTALQARCEKLDQELVELRRTGDEMSETISQMKTDPSSTRTTSPMQNSTTSIDAETKQKVVRLDRDRLALARRVDELQREVGKVNSHATEQASKPASSDVDNELTASDRIVGRVEKLETAIYGRISRDDPAASSQASAIGESVTERISQAEKQIEQVEADAMQREGIFTDHLEGELKTIQDRLDAANSSRLQDMQKVANTMSNLETGLIDTRASLGQKTSQSTLDSLRAELQAEVNQMRAQIASRPPLQTPPIQQGGFAQQVRSGPPQPNGPIAASHAHNGVNGVVPTNNIRPPGAPSPGPQTPQDQILDLRAKFDQLVYVTNHLKQRMDNLTTDEIVRAMADQMSTMYPHAKDFQAAMQTLREKHQNLSTWVERLQIEKDAAFSGAAETANEAKTAAAAAQTAVTLATSIANEANERAESALAETAAVKTAQEKMIGKHPEDHAQELEQTKKLSQKLDAFRDDMHEIESSAKAADQLSKEICQRLRKAKLEEMNAQLVKLTTSVDSLTQGFDVGKEEIRVLRHAMAAFKDEIADSQAMLEMLEEDVAEHGTRLGSMKGA